MEEEKILGCLGDGATDTDYLLCNGDSDLLPPLVKKDEIRFEYNQANQSWSKVSCTIFAALGMYSDLTNYEFSIPEIKEVDETSYDNPDYTHVRQRGHGWYVADAVKHVRDYVNNREDLVKKYGKVAYYRISKYDNDIIEGVLDKLYTIDGNFCPTGEYILDYSADGMLDGKDFGTNTNGHSVDIIKANGQRSVKDNYKGRKYNIYGLKNKLSSISNFGTYFYVYTLVGENLERVKKLNEMKTKIINGQNINSELWNMSGSQTHKDKLHDMNNFYRDWVAYIDSELKTLI